MPPRHPPLKSLRLSNDLSRVSDFTSVASIFPRNLAGAFRSSAAAYLLSRSWVASLAIRSVNDFRPDMEHPLPDLVPELSNLTDQGIGQSARRIMPLSGR